MKNKDLKANGIEKGSYFVACWGYDQTQYSIYKVIKTTGKSTVFVTPVNNYSRITDTQLAPGSVIKTYKYTEWDHLTQQQRQDFESRGFDRWNYNIWKKEEAQKAAEEVEIIKKQKNDYSYIFTLSDGRDIDLRDNVYYIEQIRALKKCIVNFKHGEPSIKIDDVITARLDQNYFENKKRYEQQNKYTAYNGR